MTYQLNETHFQSVISLPGPKRYEYFVKRVADWQQAWALEGEKGWLTGKTEAGITHLPLWAHALFAEMCTSGNWAGARVVPIEVHELVHEVLPRLVRENTLVSVMPVPEKGGVLISPKQLQDDLLVELEKIE